VLPASDDEFVQVVDVVPFPAGSIAALGMVARRRQERGGLPAAL
jgi:hypothetical protein